MGALAVDPAEPEILTPIERRAVLLQVLGDAEKYLLGSEGLVDLVGPEGAGVDRPGDELPERVELPELRPFGLVVIGGGIVHVGRYPDHIADAMLADEGEEARELELAAQRGTVVAIGPRFEGALGHVGI